MNELVTLIDQFRKDEELEFEVRVCPSDPSCISIPKAHFERILTSMINAHRQGIFTGKGPEKERGIDMFCNGGLRCRTMGVGKGEFIRKTFVRKTIAVCPARALALHFNLKREEVISPVQPLLESCTFVRMYFVFTFVYKNLFEYSFKICKSGKTKEDACRAAIVYELEIELLRNVASLTELTDQELALSMIEKGLDLCGRCAADSLIPEKLSVVWPNDSDIIPTAKKSHLLKATVAQTQTAAVPLEQKQLQPVAETETEICSCARKDSQQQIIHKRTCVFAVKRSKPEEPKEGPKRRKKNPT